MLWASNYCYCFYAIAFSAQLTTHASHSLSLAAFLSLRPKISVIWCKEPAHRAFLLLLYSNTRWHCCYLLLLSCISAEAEAELSLRCVVLRCVTLRCRILYGKNFKTFAWDLFSLQLSLKTVVLLKFLVRQDFFLSNVDTYSLHFLGGIEKEIVPILLLHRKTNELSKTVTSEKIEKKTSETSENDKKRGCIQNVVYTRNTFGIKSSVAHIPI